MRSGLPITLGAEIMERRPRAGDGAAGTRSDNRRHGVEAARPFVDLEHRGGGALGVAKEDRRGRLRREAVFVEIGGERGHAGQREIEFRHGIAELPGEGGEKAADAGIDMEPDAAPLGEGAELRDRIDDAARKAGRGADDHDGVVVGGSGDRLRVGAEIGSGIGAANLQIHEARRLAERGMRGIRHDEVAAVSGIAAPAARPVAAGLHRHDDALGAAGAEMAGRAVGSMEKIEADLDDFLLHLNEARKGAPCAERVFGEVEAVGLPADIGNVVGAAAEDVGGEAAAAPIGVRGRAGLQLDEQLRG